jgi:predicted nucleic acid-binding protein
MSRTRKKCDFCGRTAAEHVKVGERYDNFDNLLAATTLKHDLVLLTRNVKDFSGLACPDFQPLVEPSLDCGS